MCERQAGAELEGANSARDLEQPIPQGSDIDLKLMEVRTRNQAVRNYVRTVEADRLDHGRALNLTGPPHTMDEAVAICSQMIDLSQKLQYFLAELGAAETVGRENAHPADKAGVGDGRDDHM